MKILALTHRLPYAPNRGDRIRSYHLLRALSEGAEVHLFSFADQADTRHVASLQSWLASVTIAVPSRPRNLVRAALSLAGTRPLTHVLLSAPDAERRIAQLVERIRPDVVLAYCSGMARFAGEGALAGIPCVLDMVDVDSLKWLALSTSASAPMRWIYRREAHVLSRFEAQASRHAAAVLVVNGRERDALNSIAPGAPIIVVECGVDSATLAPPGPPASTPSVVFCGVMDYPPNVEAVCWFVKNIWPTVRRAVPEATFTIVGSRPTRSIARLHGSNGIHVTGEVADVRPFLWRSAVAVAPLLTARGVQSKALEALAAGLPIVVTSAVAEGLPACALPACQVADLPQRWIEALVALLQTSPAERRRLSHRATLTDLTWPACLRDVPSIMEAAARSRFPA